MKKFILDHKLLIFILVLGFILRIFQAKMRFLYGHDQDLAGWVIKDVVLNHHSRLIGQETSTHGVFIGPLFYYLLIPFYLLSNMDPIGGTYLVALLGVFGIASFYITFSRIFSKRTGLIAAFIYSTSFYTVSNDLEVVPTMPVIIWTVWYFCALYLIKEGKHRVGFILAGILVGLIWHLNVALILLIPLILISFILSKKKIQRRSLFLGIGALGLTSLPLIVFELRHKFSQTAAVFSSLTTSQSDIISGYEKLLRVIYLMSKNVHGLVMGSLPWFSFETVFYATLAIFAYLVIRKGVERRIAILMGLWVLVYIVFFASYSKIISEYYLNGIIVVWIAVFSLATSYLLERKELRHLGIILLSVFLVFNLNKFFTNPVNKSGYVERRAVVAEIKRDSMEKSFDCVSISYITDPGYDLGYRYFFWLEEVKLAPISERTPVYTIVFPLKEIFRVDKTFGAIGLIYPDYKRYSTDVVKKSCEGDDFNLTYPMFGYTE